MLGFISTSLDESVAKGFMTNAYFKIIVPRAPEIDLSL